MVAMSGGVDSSVTAWLLKSRGESIAGMFMLNWDEPEDRERCTAPQDAADAQAVAEMLGIPFHVRNFSAEYWDQVFAEFLDELAAGRTPNPDVLCNREIKFKVFLEHATDLGADSIATGHYARRRERDGRFELLKGVDPAKDQSYFLYLLDQQQLARARFPVGELTKTELRKIAADAGLPTAQKKDSTGICFIGERRFDHFISRYLDAEPGEIRTTDHRVIGTHRGLIHYTLGQRKGLGIGGVRGFEEAPWYVVAKDLEHNCLFVTQDPADPHLNATRLRAIRPHWISGQPPDPERPVAAKIRYRQADQSARIVSIDDHGFELQFEGPQRAVTPGQSVVLYDGEVCLGGGIIDSSNALQPGWPA
ncbi:MAG: tRNA 2-thiouridine(34) synthase MnmA [Wenzhouxiangellaceae bacterium]